MVRYALTLALLALTGCLGSRLVPCGDQLCPVNATCVADEICARADQIDACTGLADGDECTFSGGAGRCDRGVCIGNTCGNGELNPGEACDDGNEVSGDGCRADCLKVEECGDTIVDDGEGCDDGNDNPGDGCDACVPMTWQATVLIGGNANATLAGLGRPEGVVIDRHGNVYIADTGNHRVRRVDVTGVITVIAGTGVQGDSGDGGLGPAAQLNQPHGVAVDGLGNVYIADTWNFRVRRVSATGVITTVAGTGVIGYSGDGGPATSAQLGLPEGVAVDGLGTLYIAEGVRVRRVDPNGIITTFAGDGGGGAPDGDGGSATDATLGDARGIALDGLGNVFIAATSAHTIRKIDSSGTITRVAGAGDTLGYTGDGGPATSARLHYPEAIAADSSGNLYIGDSGNDVVRRVSPNGVITTVATDLRAPRGVALDASGTVYIADTHHNQIRRLDGAALTTIAGSGASGFAGDGGAATSARLGYVNAIAADAQGNIYIVDNENHRVHKMDASGVITTIAGGSGSGFAGDGGPAIDAVLNSPRAVVVDAAGNVYIADGSNNRVRRIDTAGVITTFAGTGANGYYGDGGLATDAQLTSPAGLAIDATGDIYISDTGNHCVRRVDAAGVIETVAGTGLGGYGGDYMAATVAQIYYPVGLAFDTAGNLYIADGENHRIRMVDTSGVITTFAGNGNRSGGGDNGSALTAGLAYPEGLAIDAANNLYIGDASNLSIRKVSGGIITTIAGGDGAVAGDGGPAVDAGLYYPQGVLVHQGLVHFTDNKRVARIEADGTLTTIAGAVDPEGMGPLAQARLADARALVISAPWTVVAGGATGTVQLARADAGRLEAVAGRYPQIGAIGSRARYRGDAFGDVAGVAYDASNGRIYLTAGNTIHVVTTTADPSDASTWTIEAFANASGTAGFSDGSAASAKFRAPTGLFLDTTANELLVADTGNHAVRAISLATGMTRTVAGTPGIRGKFGDGGPATQALLYEPRAVTRCGNELFIADTSNQRIVRIANLAITTVLGDGTAASSGEGGPATTFPVDKPLGLVCDATGNLFVTSTSTVRLLPANASGVVDGTGEVQTIYGRAPADTFPESVSRCLTGIAVVDAATVAITDACAGVFVSLHRQPK